MQRLQRRKLLGASAALAFGATAKLQASDRRGLITDPRGMLDLPQGFSYRVLSRTADLMSDGYRVPGRPDAMGVFTTPAGIVLMRNHEVTEGARDLGPYPPRIATPSEAYDPNGFGGVTRTLLDPRSLEPRSSNLALCGTHWNCAGGLSPWGWLSCEETTVPGHGYVFLCAADAPQLMAARKIASYGRFRHEAATVDPVTNIAYLTEDREDAAFYRFLPERRDTPFRGRLQALRVLDQPNFDANTLSMGVSLPVTWVDVPEPDSEDDSVRYQAHERGAARFTRCEGMWLADQALYFCATTGGPIGRGQIFRLEHTLAPPRLQLLVQSIDTSVLDMPDNITVSPRGQVFVAEDGLEGNYLRQITPGGQVVDFARNVSSTGEFAGPCFSPDGRCLFVNLQYEGVTLAIRGPFADDVWLPRSNPSPPAAGNALTAGALGLGVGALALALAALADRKRQSSGSKP